MSEMTLQSQDSKSKSWRSEAEHAPLGHGGSPQNCVLWVDGEETILFLLNRQDRETSLELSRERELC